jgi:3-hydroxy-9,10-secoandrosta-1,3,5(10)-triene-9,17-dione monooxygenase reductase component
MSLESDFKDALAAWASGVSVVTAADGELVYGLTVSSFSSLSLDPPLVLVCLANSNRLPAMIAEAGAFGVSILDRKQEQASNLFASRGREPSSDLTALGCRRTESGAPVVDGAMGWLSCSLQDSIEQGDHTIFVGRVLEASANPEGEPLLYFRRAYRGVDGL